ncbi:DNA polymerase [Fowl aviadenovirus C]|uniref:DNA polymerase n=4 Tax=Fowl aviadenovirus C TaxID=190063 RepID=F2VJG6_9ADEN|nr:DNA polymerase [Fowl aviadenovirus C]ADQ39053.1 DNA polymerase [Fowl aviadenovirus C]AKN35179.1 DNA polymerase [Fowl aviadenovirus C]QGQ62378.1 DNA polymerase [Fowl aviadenovirus C]WQI83268.1 DNA polymerase [Fowl aviadenovirus C]
MEHVAAGRLRRSILGEHSHLVRTVPRRQRNDPDSAPGRPPSTLFKTVPGDVLKNGIFYIEGEPFKLQCVPFARGMKKFLKLHKFLLTERSRQYDIIDYGFYERDPTNSLRVFRPKYIGVLKFLGRNADIERLFEDEAPLLPPILLARDARREPERWLWVLSRTAVQHCPTCGRHWVRNHACNERRSAFYYHAVQKTGSEMWQHVHFSCPAQSPHCKQLFLTYDIETYTVFEQKGKRMQPFMLCFMLSGDPALVEVARKIALEDTDVRQLDEGFYWIDPKPGEVARRFRTYRTRLQQHFAEHLVRRYCRANREFCGELMSDGNYTSIYHIPYEKFLQPSKPLTLPSDFYSVDVIVLGHNITKFDELLLATELVERRDLFPDACRCDRSFMPRVGRLLFNDILFHMPNPNFSKKDPTRLHRWVKGVVDERDMRSVFVRFMVRDTLQLTSGAKLAKAASAYALELSKGHCPYEAINEHVSRGHYDRDADGFPVARYWEDASVLDEQKQLWNQNHPGQPYDLVRACLEYCMQDVRVTQKLAHTLFESYDRYFKQELGMHGNYNIFVRPTIPSNTHAFWKQLTFSQYVQEQLDKRQSKPAKRNKKGNKTNKSIPTDYVAEVYAPHRPMFKYIRQALRGGRCYPSVLGPFTQPVYVFDICGMYASALTHPMPHGMPLDPKFTAAHVDELNAILLQPAPISYFDARIKPSILKIEAYPPPPEQLDTLPPLCNRRGGRLVWANEVLYDEVVTVLDIITLHNRGWKVTALHDDMNIVFPEWKTICADYVSKNIAAKEKADQEKNEVMRSISKMLSNALYGAFATNMDTTRIVFEQDLTDKDKKEIYEGTQVVKHVTLLNDRSFSGKTLYETGDPFSAPSLLAHFKPPEESDDEEEEDSEHCESTSKDENVVLTAEEEADLSEVDQELEEALTCGLYIDDGRPPAETNPAHSRANETAFKPVRFLDAPPEALTVLHLESLDKQVENKRYATQIACFVLGWSRAFFSEWCEILHGPDRGTHILHRELQTLYGDTDSLFLSETGYERMKTRGAHRIKSKSTRLTFDPEKPDLYWACDCDIKCKQCGSDTYSSEAIFLAPKLYGLKDAVCTNPQCGYVGTGKIRSKGHKQAELIYDTLLRCWMRYEDQLFGADSRIPELHTRRTIFKTTLLNKVSRYEPFTIHNEQLTRILRPWKDPTQYQYGNALYPYDTEHPNPRTVEEVRHVSVPGDEEPLAPLRIDPYAFLTAEECDEILELLGETDERDP